MHMLPVLSEGLLSMQESGGGWIPSLAWVFVVYELVQDPVLRGLGYRFDLCVGRLAPRSSLSGHFGMSLFG